MGAQLGNMESGYLQDLLSDLWTDNNPLEDTKSIVDLLSDKDLLLFDSDLSLPGEQSAEHGGHIQQGVINFSVSKILNTIEHHDPHPEVEPITPPAPNPSITPGDQAPLPDPDY